MQIAAVRQEAMYDQQRYKRLLARFRYMMVQSGALPMDVTEAQLLDKVRGDTEEERIESLENLTGLLPEFYWEEIGL